MAKGRESKQLRAVIYAALGCTTDLAFTSHREDDGEIDAFCVTQAQSHLRGAQSSHPTSQITRDSSHPQVKDKGEDM
ncbi:hypothetical protein K461DRAFT_277888 [Myriangium duriaei CBS 260.36]|uniref:Uncharacterized protein n=1 Tax=Myriangium duriaei CBS 260.36 TaxID=1168546 RepID=A0A9P4MKF6_9PEZI|nr:hypothetical protein K461DRAFT_277888 [Myriangium duriaei CBS 260.36]